MLPVVYGRLSCVPIPAIGGVAGNGYVKVGGKVYTQERRGRWDKRYVWSSVRMEEWGNGFWETYMVGSFGLVVWGGMVV